MVFAAVRVGVFCLMVDPEDRHLDLCSGHFLSGLCHVTSLSFNL